MTPAIGPPDPRALTDGHSPCSGTLRRGPGSLTLSTLIQPLTVEAYGASALTGQHIAIALGHSSDIFLLGVFYDFLKSSSSISSPLPTSLHPLTAHIAALLSPSPAVQKGASQQLSAQPLIYLNVISNRFLLLIPL
jgi:hypothetical protein